MQMNSDSDRLRNYSSEVGRAAAFTDQLKATFLFYLGYTEHKLNSIMCSPTKNMTIKVPSNEECFGTNEQKAASGTSATNTLKYLIIAAVLSVSMLEFSLWFPYVLPGLVSAAVKTYVPAFYAYDDEQTQFDNTPWTYNTDYLLTIVMSILAIKCITAYSPDNDAAQKNRRSLHLRLYSASLLICYAISTLAGAWSHQHFTSIESMNTTRFRIFWITCVGNVSFASCYMGLIGREVQRHFGVPGAVPMPPWWFWPMYGCYQALACGLGYISFKRPACDIFIAGITQFPSTFYCIGALGFRRWPSFSSKRVVVGKETSIELVGTMYRLMYYVGFISNAPLLPIYPILVQYTNMSLGAINTFLHCWLMITWGMQGISLVHLCRAISSGEKRLESDTNQFTGGLLLFYTVVSAPLILMAAHKLYLNA